MFCRCSFSLPLLLADPIATPLKGLKSKTAPYLIIVFKKLYDITPEAEKKQNYYVNESVGIATGILLSSLQIMGLVTLTHTPSPMNFLQKILNRPSNEKPYLLIPVGYPAKDAVVPDIKKKDMKDIMIVV